MVTYKRSHSNSNKLLNIPLSAPCDRWWLIICQPINCELFFSVAELYESSSRQSATVTAVRQREEVGAHLWSGGHWYCHCVQCGEWATGDGTRHHWCFTQPYLYFYQWTVLFSYIPKPFDLKASFRHSTLASDEFASVRLHLHWLGSHETVGEVNAIKCTILLRIYFYFSQQYFAIQV